MWTDLWGDLRLACRQLRRQPAFSLTCIAVLAFGLGATAAIFSVLYTTVLKPLPYPDPDQLVAVHNRFPQLHLPRLPASTLDYLDLRQHRELFAEAGAFYFLDLSRTGVERPEKVNAVASTASLFRTLKVSPMLGRNFNAQEESYRGPRAVILSESYWKREFGGDPLVLNRTLQLNGELYRIVGVMPQSFQFPNKVTEMWTPITFQPKWLQPAARQSHFLRMYARLAPGIDFKRAETRIEELSRQMSLQHPEDYPLERLGWRFFLLPMARDDDGSLRRWLYVLFAAAICLLLIVCSNVAGLSLVRSMERQFELSIRMALGAGRFRVARQALTEVLLLAICGGLAGLWVLTAGVSFFARIKHAGDPRIDPAVYLFLILSSLVTGLACGLYPAWLATGIVPAQSLREGGHQRTSTGRQRKLRHALTAGQVAIATTLLISGGLLIHSLLRILETPPGFDPQHVLTMQVSLPGKRYDTAVSRARFYGTLLDRIRRMPGVEAASACTLLPFGYGENANTFEILGRPKPRVEPYANLNNVLPDFLRTMRIPLLKGRFFTVEDRAGSQPVTVIDDTMAKRYFHGEDPIGRQVRMPWDKPFTVVGVVGSVKTAGLDVDSRPTLYFSALQYPSTDMSLVIRGALPEESLTGSVRRAVAELDKDQPIYAVSSMRGWIDKSLETRRLAVDLIAAFAAAGMALAALGLYGVLSYAIALRRREIGIRMALGAGSGAIASLVARSGMRMAAAGMLAGAAGAMAAHRFLQAQLYHTRLYDGFTWAAVLGLITLICFLACAIPAWRATRIDPVDCLRRE